MTRVNHLIFSLIPVTWMFLAYQQLADSIFYMPKWVFVGMLTAASLLFSLRLANSQCNSSTRKLNQLYFSLLEMVIVVLMVFRFGNFENMEIPKAVSFGIGLIIYFISFTFIGLKRNLFLGIKTPGALESDQAWEFTHKVAAVIWPLASLGLFGQLFWDGSGFSVPIFLGSMIFLLIPLGASYSLE